MDVPKKKILVADDDPGILDVIKIILEDMGGYEVEVTNDGRSVLDLQGPFPDLILLDLWMSGMNGSEICLNLKADENTKQIPVVIFSANKEIKNIAQEVGADDYISKPFQMKDLLNKVENLIA